MEKTEKKQRGSFFVMYKKTKTFFFDKSLNMLNTALHTHNSTPDEILLNSPPGRFESYIPGRTI